MHLPVSLYHEMEPISFVVSVSIIICIRLKGRQHNRERAHVTGTTEQNKEMNQHP